MKEINTVLPGDKVSTEEEFLPSEHIFAENGNLYATLAGKPLIENGHISIQLDRGIKKYKKGMFVSGVIVGDLKSVLFVKIDDFVIDGNKYVGITDGKIIIPKPRDIGGVRDGREPQRPCSMGDVVLARIFMIDHDSYTLSFRDPDAGVITSRCDRCGEAMIMDNRGIICPLCEFRARKKISPLYGKSHEIEEKIKNSINDNDYYLKTEDRQQNRRPRYNRNNN